MLMMISDASDRRLKIQAAAPYILSSLDESFYLSYVSSCDDGVGIVN